VNAERACEMHQSQTFVHLTKNFAAAQQSPYWVVFHVVKGGSL
jgi:hypothetical protein